MQCFWPVAVSPVHLGAFFHNGNKLIGHVGDSTFTAVMPTPGVRIALSESLISVLGSDSEWSDLLGMKLNASKTKTTIVYRSRTIHTQSPALTIGRTVLM